MKDDLPSLESLLGPIRQIAREASVRILEIYDTNFSIETKSDRSPVTDADLAAHHLICAGLQELTPHIPILSEESTIIPYTTRSSWERYWLIDPLDGTKEFIKKSGEFTVNISLIEGKRSILGVVDVPVDDIAYYASFGSGAFKSQSDGKSARISTRKVDTSHIIISSSRSHGEGMLAEFTKNLPGKVELISKGSSLKLCMVADGCTDIYARFAPTSEWDTAAAQCIVEEAGGAVVDFSSEPIVYNQKENILNPYFLAVGDSQYDWTQHLPS